jgi:uncharacterized protein YjbI with pentapeptide repeats
MRTERQRPKSWKETSASFKEDDWRLAFVGFEWLCEWAAYGLSGLAFLKVLEYLGKLTILVSLILWIYPGFQERRQAAESAKQAAADARISRHYVAWQTINSAMGKPGNGGRADALQDLNQDGIPMDGISLTGGVVLVGPLNLTNATMTHADFSDGTYENINFNGATLDFSKWNNTMSENCNFRSGSFWAATFNHSTFVWCDFSNALFQTQFTGDHSEFRVCNFTGAAFPMCFLNSVEFFGCNLAYADLTHALIGVNGYTNTADTFFCCNLYGATASPDTIKFVSHQLVAFTNVVSLEEWEHCVTNGVVMRFQKGGPEFMSWASNQFSIYYKTNDPQAWLNWSSENLKN